MPQSQLVTEEDEEEEEEEADNEKEAQISSCTPQVHNASTHAVIEDLEDQGATGGDIWNEAPCGGQSETQEEQPKLFDWMLDGFKKVGVSITTKKNVLTAFAKEVTDKHITTSPTSKPDDK